MSTASINETSISFDNKIRILSRVGELVFSNDVTSDITSEKPQDLVLKLKELEAASQQAAIAAGVEGDDLLELPFTDEEMALQKEIDDKTIITRITHVFPTVSLKNFFLIDIEADAENRRVAADRSNWVQESKLRFGQKSLVLSDEAKARTTPNEKLSCTGTTHLEALSTLFSKVAAPGKILTQDTEDTYSESPITYTSYYFLDENMEWHSVKRDKKGDFPTMSLRHGG